MVRASCWKARGRWIDSRCRNIFSFWFFRLLPVAHSSAKLIPIKSTMRIIQTYGCKEIDLIFKKYGGGINDDMSAFTSDIVSANFFYLRCGYELRYDVFVWIISKIYDKTLFLQLSLHQSVNLKAMKFRNLILGFAINLVFPVHRIHWH